MAACLGGGRLPAPHVGEHRRSATAAEDAAAPGNGRAAAGGPADEGNRRRPQRRRAASSAAFQRSTCSGSSARSCCRSSTERPFSTAARCCRPTSARRSKTRRAASGSRRRCICAASSSPANPCRRAVSRSSRRCRSVTRSLGESEHLLQAPVLEIYGSTETGALALRRTARATRWLPMDGVQLERVDGATLGRGAHFASPVKLLDELVVERNGSFTLLGRQADLIKIAGRRASLAGLNLLLQDLPGLEDGVFYLPADRQSHRAAVPDLCGRAAGPGGDATLAADAARSGVPAARLHPARPPAAQRERQAAPAMRSTLPMRIGNPRRSHSKRFARLASHDRAAVS